MADWTNVLFAYGSLLTSTKMSQLDANFDALAEGAASAPNIETAAITDGAVTTAKVNSAAILGYRHLNNSASTVITTIAHNGSITFSAGLFAVYTVSGSSSALPYGTPPHYCVDMDHRYRHYDGDATWYTRTVDRGIWTTVWSDGSNFKVINVSGNDAAVIYRKL